MTNPKPEPRIITIDKHSPTFRSAAQARFVPVHDPELAALTEILRLLLPLHERSRERILAYVTSKYGIKESE